MKLKDQLRFRELQTIFFLGMSEYPNDKERLEKMFVILENFIDDVVTRECSALVAVGAQIREGGKIKGGGGSGGFGGTIH